MTSNIWVLVLVASVASENPVQFAEVLQSGQCDHEIAEEIVRGPTFTPFHVAPRLLDRDGRLDELRGGIAALNLREPLKPIVSWVLVSPQGCVARVEIESRSGDAQVDAVVQRWLESAEFTRPILRYGPQLERERAVPAWVRERVELDLLSPTE